MSKIFYPTSEKLSFLLESIHNREIALPDFQRDFVWDPRETEELIESICQNFPAGSLLRIKNSAGFFFKPREFAGAAVLNGHAPSYLILDGQQRLTSLYQALFGAGSHRYFIDLQAILNGDDLEDSVFYLRRNDAQKKYGEIQQQADALVFPFETIFGSAGGFEVWLDAVLDLRPNKATLKADLRSAQKEWLKPVEDYEFPMVTLGEATTPSAVCTIFETLNRTGVKLSVFDLLVARFWSEDVKLRDLWEEAKDTHAIIADFDVDPYYVLQSVAIFAAEGAASCKRKDVLRMTVGQIRKGWAPVVDALAEALHMLRNECGVILPQWLPYNTIVIPLAALLAHLNSTKGPAAAANRRRLRRWFWCSVFGQTYEKAPNSQSVKDYTEVIKWCGGGEPPAAVSGFSFDISALRQTTPRQRAVYRGVIALLLRNGATDFHSDKPITASMVRELKIDDHHVFPQGFLAEHRPTVTATQRDCVLNRTLIDKQTNIRIGKRAPSDYLDEIRSVAGAKHLESLYRTHLLPGGAASPLIADNFEGFQDARQSLIESALAAATEPGT